MKSLPYIMVLFGAMLWGTTGTTQTFLQEGISPFSVACVRSGIGGGLLLIITLVMKKMNWRTWPWKWNILAALAIALFQCLFFSSIRFTGVAIGTVMTIGSSPVFSGLLEWTIWKERPSRIWAWATSFAIIGCAMLFINRGEGIIDPFGIGLALCAGLMFALYTNVSKQLMEQVETLPAVAMTFSLCAAILAPIALMEGVLWITDKGNLLPMLYMGIITTSIAYLLFLAGLRFVNSSAAVTLSLAEPLTAALLGVLFLGEYLSLTSWAGVLLILGGIVVLTFGNNRTTSPEEA
ncbi:DMT family transporter [Lysinibacillus odysseyi]|uniref:Transporter n=1 Tax=Lysinibacillus odysseyi 34hs-1 = NBRC 100172 TaxID=1220589 RepID=A0A0A3ISM5_9BACI|nr:EamA family transporter [Lysinibacillus odysseyi]KGR85863.1 transporter [Lysinibacillus odysseyi 34hs-1 = NBRC 100172]